MDKMFFPPTPRERHLSHLNYKTYTIFHVALVFTKEKKLELDELVFPFSTITGLIHAQEGSYIPQNLSILSQLCNISYF